MVRRAARLEDHQGDHQGRGGQNGGMTDGDRAVNADEQVTAAGALLQNFGSFFGDRNQSLHNDTGHHRDDDQTGGDVDHEHDDVSPPQTGEDTHEDTDETAEDGRFTDDTEFVLNVFRCATFIPVTFVDTHYLSIADADASIT